MKSNTPPELEIPVSDDPKFKILRDEDKEKVLAGDVPGDWMVLTLSVRVDPNQNYLEKFKTVAIPGAQWLYNLLSEPSWRTVSIFILPEKGTSPRIGDVVALSKWRRFAYEVIDFRKI